MAYTSNQNINGLEAKATPIGADQIVIGDTADSNRAKKTTFTQLLTFLTTNLTSFFNKSSDTLDDITTGSTNVHFTASDNTKLDGIETAADVTDENNVVAALSGATLTAVTVAGTDKVVVQDADDSDNIKTVTAQSIADLGGGGGDMSASTYDPATIAEQLVGLTATQTLTNKTLTTPTLTLKQSTTPAPTAEGDIQWDTDNNQIAVGDGAGTKVFSDDSVNSATYAPIADPTFTGEIGIGAVNVSETELGILEGATLTTTELNYVDGVTSAIQTQIDAKAPTASPTFTGTVTLPVGLTGVIRADSGVVSTDSDVTDIVAAASTSAAGKVELATSAETTTGTDTGRAITPDGLAGSDYGKRIVGIQVFDSATDTATGDGKAFFRVPSALNGYNLVGVAANVYTAGTTGTTDIQIRNVTDSQDMLSTKLTIDSGETDSSTAATPAVINTTYDDVATGDKIAIDVDAVSTTAAQGLYVELIFQLA